MDDEHEFQRLDVLAWRIVSDLRTRRRETRDQSVRRMFIGSVADAFEHEKRDDADQERQCVSDHPSCDHQTYRAHLRTHRSCHAADIPETEHPANVNKSARKIAMLKLRRGIAHSRLNKN